MVGNLPNPNTSPYDKGRPGTHVPGFLRLRAVAGARASVGNLP
jgi:hypothetical protein